MPTIFYLSKQIPAHCNVRPYVQCSMCDTYIQETCNLVCSGNSCLLCTPKVRHCTQQYPVPVLCHKPNEFIAHTAVVFLFRTISLLHNHPLLGLPRGLMPSVFRRVREIAKKTVIFDMCVCPSVRPHGTTRLPLDRFS